jgi:hypothetical protein
MVWCTGSGEPFEQRIAGSILVRLTRVGASQRRVAVLPEGRDAAPPEYPRRAWGLELATSGPLGVNEPLLPA